MCTVNCSNCGKEVNESDALEIKAFDYNHQRGDNVDFFCENCVGSEKYNQLVEWYDERETGINEGTWWGEQ